MLHVLLGGGGLRLACGGGLSGNDAQWLCWWKYVWKCWFKCANFNLTGFSACAVD